MLEHVGAHRVGKLVLETFILKVELCFVTAVVPIVVLQLNQVEVDLHSAFWNGLGLVGLGKLDLVLHDIGVLLHEEHLVDVDFAPLDNDVFNDLLTFLFFHW